MIIPTTPTVQHRHEVGFKQFLTGMSVDSLLRLARCLWWEALRDGNPIAENDARMLELVSAECDRRELSTEFEALEGAMRAELIAKGLLKRPQGRGRSIE